MQNVLFRVHDSLCIISVIHQEFIRSYEINKPRFRAAFEFALIVQVHVCELESEFLEWNVLLLLCTTIELQLQKVQPPECVYFKTSRWVVMQLLQMTLELLLEHQDWRGVECFKRSTWCLMQTVCGCFRKYSSHDSSEHILLLRIKTWYRCIYQAAEHFEILLSTENGGLWMVSMY